MLPLLPALLGGTAVVAGLTLARNRHTGRRLADVLQPADQRLQGFAQRRIDPLFETGQRGKQVRGFAAPSSPEESALLTLARNRHMGQRLADVLQPADQRLQGFVRRRIDPLFETGQRGKQVREFAAPSSPEELAINRRLALSLLNVNIALLGAVFYAPLSWLSGAGLLLIFAPQIRRSSRILIRERRLKYSLIGLLSLLAAAAAGLFVTASLLAVVFLLGFKISARTEAGARVALTRAFAMQTPATLWVRAGDVETEIPFAELRLGDVVVLSAGQHVPIDGRVDEGMATVDQHLLTGESHPVEKSAGDPVFANTLVLTGRLYVRVERTGQATAAAQIGSILGDIATHRLEHEARSEQLADRLTLPVLAATGLALATVGTNGAVAILNSGFGSTMYLSGPLNMLSYLNLASRRGILVKDGRSLELLHEVDTVVFDKTGTLTLEQPEIAAIHCHGKWDQAQVLALAAVAEFRQTHPVARAILDAAAQGGLDAVAPDSSDSAYRAGFGVRVCHQGHEIRVGSPRFMAESGIAIPEAIVAALADCHDTGGSLVMVAVDEDLAGALELRAQLRPDAADVIAKLRRRGLRLCILSGDHEAPTRHLAERLGVTESFAEVLPAGKGEVIRGLREAGRKVCFVGDGLNDAVALREADVSVSLRGATTLATDMAQIVLLSESLEALDELFELTAGFNRNRDVTLRLAYIPGATLIAGVFLFHFGMGAALLLYGAGMMATLGHALAPLRQLESMDEKPAIPAK